MFDVKPVKAIVWMDRMDRMDGWLDDWMDGWLDGF